MPDKLTEKILQSLLRINRATQLFSRKITRRHNLTIPQLLILQQLHGNGEQTPSALARAVSISRPTMTGLLDRLEDKKLVERSRLDQDRRKVFIRLTQQGAELAGELPQELQEDFYQRFQQLPLRERENIDQVLRRVAAMMGQAQGET